jgi:hypothetical protein
MQAAKSVHVVADSPALIAALRDRAMLGPERLTLVLPCTGPGLAARQAARASLDAALAAWREAGLEAEGVVGAEDPIEAVLEVWDPRRFDEIVVSTLSGSSSRWLRFDLPSRLARVTDAQVKHVGSPPRAHAAEAAAG